MCGFSLVFSAFGAVAGLAGSWVDASRVWIERIGGIGLIALGLLLVVCQSGRLSIHWRPVVAGGVSGAFRPLAIGVAFGAAWTPCVGPLLGAALLAAAHGSTALSGAFTLFVYSLGVGIPFVVVSAIAASMPAPRWRFGRISRVMQRVSSAALIVLGLVLVSGSWMWLSSRAAQLIDSVV